MPDPFHHDDLTSLETREETWRLAEVIANELQSRPVTAAMAACAAVFVTLARLEGADPADALAQLHEAFDTDQMALPEHEGLTVEQVVGHSVSVH